MKAGRELDALIAEKVMGWKPVFLDDDVIVAWNIGNGRELLFTDPTQSDNEWSPSTNISDAWKVVEKTKASIYSQLGDPPISHTYLIEISNLGTVYESFGETAPLAICLCALKSVEVKV